MCILVSGPKICLMVYCFEVEHFYVNLKLIASKKTSKQLKIKR